MTVLPDWMYLGPEGLTVAEYEALPEEVRRRIEVVDGAIIVSPSPSRAHQIFARRLANKLEEACATRSAVATDVDLRLYDVPLYHRRPDIVVYDADLADEEDLQPQHCLLVVEVMSPGSVDTDRFDKPREYAHAKIEHFWRVEKVNDAKSAPIMYRYRLSPTTDSYLLVGEDVGRVDISEPFKLSLDLSNLTEPH